MARQGSAGNARAQEQKRQAEQLLSRQRVADLKELLSMPLGRRFLWDLVDYRCNAHGTGYSSSGSELYFNTGQRSVGVALLKDIRDLDPKSYVTMLQEATTAYVNLCLTRDSAESKAITEADPEEGADNA
jgi:hypothetical protein